MATAGRYDPKQAARDWESEKARRQSLVGKRIPFLRFGDIPASGQSRNFRDGHSEGGVSCYEILADGSPNMCGWPFGIMEGRPKISGTGIVIGWGSDGEPLIDSKSIQINNLLRGAPNPMNTYTHDNTEGYTDADLETLNRAHREIARIKSDYPAADISAMLSNAWSAELPNTVEALVARALS